MNKEEIDDLLLNLLEVMASNELSIEDRIHNRTIELLNREIRKVLDQEPYLIQLKGDFHVIGDIHGNASDLVRIFEKVGYPPENKFLFLGDYIDRGTKGVEVLTFLFALKLRFPDHIFLLRGNHEFENLSIHYGFYQEVANKYKVDTFISFQKTFTFLPLAATINDKYFCVHAGISQYLFKVSELLRFTKPSHKLIRELDTDLLWSDPRDTYDTFLPSPRGSGHIYNQEALDNFLNSNNLEFLIRSHENCQKGFDMPYKNSTRCLTIFSSSDYLGKGNKAAYLFVPEKGEFQIGFLQPITKEEQEKRRVLIPAWLEPSLFEAPICREPIEEVIDHLPIPVNVFEGISV